MNARLSVVTRVQSSATRRLRPHAGRLLTIADISGPWRPSGSVAGAGVWAVVWESRSEKVWAALADFNHADQLRLIEECRRVDIEQYGERRT